MVLLEKKTFRKPPQSIPQLLTKLAARGLLIPDPDVASHHLKYIGFYRLSGYMLPFQHQGTGDDRHQFWPGTTFDDVMDVHGFDRKLRFLVMDALERVEVAMRAAISDHMALAYGSLWFLNANRFQPGFSHREFVERLKREIGHEPGDAARRQIHIRHYYENYRGPELPPSWMLFEAIPFGVIPRCYANLLDDDRKIIAADFRLDERILHSALHALSYLRNLCAHHARVWNRVFTIKPVIPKRLKALNAPNHKFYGLAVILQDLLLTIVRDSHWGSRMAALLEQHPRIPAATLGFQPGWRESSHWKAADP